MFAKSNMDIDEPRLAKPYMLKEEPKRAKVLKEIVDPK